MNSFYPAATIILSEISIALLALCCIMAFVMIRNKRRNGDALAQLTAKVKQNEDERLASLKTKLKETHTYPDEKVDEVAAGIIKAEMIFYQGLMDTFSSGDGAALKEFDQKIDSVIDAYRNLVPQAATPPTADDTSENSETLKDEMAQLTAKNENLAKELDAIKSAMEETNEEFTRAFTRGMNKDTKPVSPEEVTADISDDAEISADTPDDTADIPEGLEPQEKAPDKAVTPEPAAAEEAAETPQQDTQPQQEPVQAADENDDEVDKVLKNIDIGDINIDSDETDKQKDETSSPDNETTDGADTADDNIDESGIDQILDEAFEQPSEDKQQEADETNTAKEKTG